MAQIDTSFFSARLQFREAGWDDIEQIHMLELLPEIDEYNTLGIPKDIEETRKNFQPFFENHKNDRRTLLCWMIRKVENNEFIGICGLTLTAERFKMGEIFYNLMPQFWGMGYGSETAKAQILFCFNRLKLHRVEAGVATENTRSIKVLEKVGMQQEGISRKILPIRGVWKDNFVYSILEDDPRDY